MSLTYWPASACKHCTCLGDGGRCCYCLHTARTLRGSQAVGNGSMRNSLSEGGSSLSSHLNAPTVPFYSNGGLQTDSGMPLVAPERPQATGK